LRNLPPNLRVLNLQLEKYNEGDLDYLPAGLKFLTFKTKMLDKPIRNLPPNLQEFSMIGTNIVTDEIDLPPNLKLVYLPETRYSIYQEQIKERHKHTNINFI
jgi:hypothetical protein